MANLTLKKKLKNFTQKPPKLGTLVEGEVLDMKKNEIYVDIDGCWTGIIRGPEAIDESGEFSNLKIGDKVSATVIEQENEKGLIELSLRIAGHQKVWQKLEELAKNKETIEVKVEKANKGGLIVSYNKISGFLPVSQLAPENYPKVKDGNKDKILEKLEKFVGEKLKAKIINVDPEKEILIFSEKEAVNEPDRNTLKEKEKFVGKIVQAKITKLSEFGAFARFDDNQEGLIHISELAWERIDKVEDVVKEGDVVKVKVLGVSTNGKFSLSLKETIPNPWEEITKKYKVGDIVKAKIVKTTPFGAFAKMKEGIQGLIHVSEIPEKTELKIGDSLNLKIVSLEPENQRLGFSLKGIK